MAKEKEQLLEADARGFDAFVRRRVIVSVDRSKGTRAILIEAHGDRKTAKYGTGTIAASGSETIYLTHTGTVGGENVFDDMPSSTVMQDRDGTPGGIHRVAGPSTPTGGFSVVSTSTVTREVFWVPANRVWAIKVTNTDTAPHNYLVILEGF